MKIKPYTLPISITTLILMLLAFGYFGVPFMWGLSWSETIVIGSIMLGFDAVAFAVCVLLYNWRK